MNAQELKQLAGLLGHPGPESLEILQEMVSEAPWMAPAITELEETPLDAWQGEHTRLFLNGIPKTLCPPFASAWQQGNLDVWSATKITGLYQRAGLSTEEDMPADFLGTLLEFLAYLEEDTFPEAVELKKILLDEHLLPWIGKFAQTLVDEPTLAIYRIVGERLKGQFGENHVAQPVE